MLVADIMTKTNLTTISPMASVREALNKMRETKVKSLIVEKLSPSDAYGIMTFKNILQSIVAEDGDIDMLNVYDICSKPAIQISKELNVKYAAQMMVNQSIKRVLVIDNNELEGILTMTNILEVLMKQAQEGE
ncbi:MAG: CBS domain-containing protein [Sulfurimonas sp.]|nr:CBS domain-containing protein [Sulfurimonas sp.]